MGYSKVAGRLPGPPACFTSESLHRHVIRQLDDSHQEVSIADHPTAMALAGVVLAKEMRSGRKLSALTVAHFNPGLAGEDKEQQPLRCGVNP